MLHTFASLLLQGRRRPIMKLGWRNDLEHLRSARRANHIVGSHACQLWRACRSRIRRQAATGSWTKSRQWETLRTLFNSSWATVCPPAKVNGVWPSNDTSHSMPSELPEEPRSCQRPVTEHGPARHLEHLGRLIDVEAAKEPELDDLTSARIDGLERLERVVQRFEVLILALNRGDLVVYELDRPDTSFIDSPEPKPRSSLA